MDYEVLQQTITRRKRFMLLTGIYMGACLILVPLVDENRTMSYILIAYGFLVLGIFVLAAYQLEQQRKEVYGLHVAVTENGIRKDSSNFPSGAFFRNTTLVRVCRDTGYIAYSKCTI